MRAGDNVRVRNLQNLILRHRFNKAAKLLSFAKQEELREYAQKLNETLGNNRPSSYLERWQREVGKNVKLILDNRGKMATKIGQLIGLRLVNMNCLAQVNIDGNISYFYSNKLQFYPQ